MKRGLALTAIVQSALCGALLLTGCPTTDTAPSKTTVLGLRAKSAAAAGVGEVPRNNEALVAQVLRLTNQERTLRGLNEVSLNPVLTQMAENYCDEMIELGFFAHRNPITEETTGERAYKAGYVFLAVGENLAAGQESAEQVVDEWMASPDHREIILGVQWRELGIGIRLGGEHGVYWVIEFGNPP